MNCKNICESLNKIGIFLKENLYPIIYIIFVLLLYISSKIMIKSNTLYIKSWSLIIILVLIASFLMKPRG